MGKVNAEGEMESVTDIHESFLNSNRLRYHCRQMLVEMDLVPEKSGGGVGDKFILDMFEWNR
jgi:hypothetical protein